MLKLTENQIRQLIRQILIEKIDPEKIRKQGGGFAQQQGHDMGPGETLGTNPAGDWTHYDTGKSDFGDADSLDEDDAGEEEEE